jgi:hypothetical protein
MAPLWFFTNGKQQEYLPESYFRSGSTFPYHQSDIVTSGGSINSKFRADNLLVLSKNNVSLFSTGSKNAVPSFRLPINWKDPLESAHAESRILFDITPSGEFLIICSDHIEVWPTNVITGVPTMLSRELTPAERAAYGL